MRLGIGVTTYNRPDHIKLWNEQMKKHLPSATIPHEIYIASDSQMRLGIAYRKNECLKALKHCDYIFLFDDDCFPIKDYWADFFIDRHKSNGQHHFLYLKPTSTIKCLVAHPGGPKWPDDRVLEYDNCGGAFMFLTKEVVEKVGGYGKYGRYGMEHCGYTERIHMAGLTPMGKYLCPAGADEYLYSMDYQFNLPFNSQVKHQSSIMNEINRAQEYINEGAKYFQEDIKTIFKSL